MTNNAGTNSELNARVTQVSNLNGSTDTMAVMTRVMEMVQQQIAQQTAQAAVQQQLTELLISQQRASQERHYEMIQWQQQTQKDMIEALRVTKQEPQNIGTRENGRGQATEGWNANVWWKTYGVATFLGIFFDQCGLQAKLKWKT